MKKFYSHLATSKTLKAVFVCRSEDSLSFFIQIHLRRDVRKLVFGFPTRSDTNQPVQSQKQARGLKFWLYVVEELYYPSSENKGADQLCSYCTADLRLCFCTCKNLVFS